MLAINVDPDIRDSDSAATDTQLLQTASFRGVNFLVSVIRTHVGFPGDEPAVTVSMPNTNLGVVYNIKPFLFGNADGIWGLAYPALNPAYTMPTDTRGRAYTQAQLSLGKPAGYLPSYVDQLVAAGLVANKFSFSVQRSAASAADAALNTGVFVLGGGEECDDLYTGTLTSVAVVHETYYNTNLLAVQVGGQTVPVAPTPVGDAAVSNSFIDSGCGGLMLDPRLYQQVITLFNRVNPMFGPMLQARSRDQTQLDLAAWPTLVFVLQGADGGRVTLAVEPKDYWQFDGSTAGTATAGLFSGGAPKPGQSILGLPLFSGHYVVFDRTGGTGNSVVKFAPLRDANAAPLVA